MKITSLIKFYIIKWYYDVYNYFTVYPPYNKEVISKCGYYSYMYDKGTYHYNKCKLQEDIDDLENQYVEQELMKSDDK